MKMHNREQRALKKRQLRINRNKHIVQGRVKGRTNKALAKQYNVHITTIVNVLLVHRAANYLTCTCRTCTHYRQRTIGTIIWTADADIA